LTIPQVKREDRGRYICDASNGIGQAVSKAVLLEVSFGAIVSSKRPKTGQKEGYEADLICKVTYFHTEEYLNKSDVLLSFPRLRLIPQQQCLGLAMIKSSTMTSTTKFHIWA
jgi:hypothetical protein